MTTETIQPKFLQIHFLAAWPGALLNRDDAGLAKQLPFGNATRTRISSQCLKRHWRTTEDRHALRALATQNGVEGVRSKIAIEREVTGPLRARFASDAVDVVQLAFLSKFYGKNAKDSQQRQALLFGRPELNWLRGQAERLLTEHTDLKALQTATDAWIKEEKNNLNQLHDQNVLSASLEAALFGRMVTSDTKANRDAAIHVAHALTVHAEQSELDYFTVVDDLRSRDQGDDAGAAGVFDTQLTSGLYYGYVVVDVPLLVSNLTGCARGDWAGEHDRNLAAQVVEHLIYLIAEVTPGAKKGSTAPYSRAELVLIEAGDRQPRTLANAFRDAVLPVQKATVQEPTADDIKYGDKEPDAPLGTRTARRMLRYMSQLDGMYQTGEKRHQAAMPDLALKDVPNHSLRELADWAGHVVRTATL